MNRIFLFNIKQLVGIQPEGTIVLKGDALNKLAVLDNAWLLTEGERILDFGKMADLPADFAPNATQIDAAGRIVLPAFVDSHTHIVYAGTREDEFEMRLSGLSYEEIAKRGGGILNSATKLQHASQDELIAQSLMRLQDVIGMGTGALEIKSGYGLSEEGELKMLRTIKALHKETDATIKSTFLALHAIPTAYKANPDAYVELMIETVLPQVTEEGLAEYIDAFCEEGYFNVEQTERLLEAGARFGLKPKVHVNQFNTIGGIAASVKHNAVSVDHLEIMKPEDYPPLQNSNTIATLLPICSLFIQIPYGPARELVKSNIALALATDFNPGSSPSGNMQLVQSLACTQMKLTPTEAFNASTINGAAALQLSHELGSITKGKIANILMTKPIPSLSYIAYNLGHNHIEKVILKGRLQG